MGEVDLEAIPLSWVEAVKLVSLRVRNYRTVGAEEQTLQLDGGLTLVGPNNSGKTNLLRAIQLLFTGWDNIQGYSGPSDLTFGQRDVKTSLLATFDGDDSAGSQDATIYDALDSLHSILGTQRASSSFTLSLQFSPSDKPVYQFFPNAKQPSANALRTQYSRTQKQLVADLLSRFECHYVPSARSMRELYSGLLVPFLRSAAATAVAPHAAAISGALDHIAASFNDELTAAGLPDLRVSFTFPDDSLEALIAGFDLLVEDPARTTVFRKGQGIQSTALLAGFLWMTQQEKARNRSVIWLLEEPESYLHPELSQSALTLLARLRQHALLVATTHALTFVPADPASVAGTTLKNHRTHVETYKTYTEATRRLRSSLGVRFSDYYALGRFNLLVEGQSDREYITWMLRRISAESEAWPCLREAEILDFGGVRHLGGFLRATYELISAERACVAVFDGDAAGEKERRDLQQFLGQKSIAFESNRHYLSVRKSHTIEGMFPDRWMSELHAQHPGWFEEWSEDVSGELETYRIRDGSKSSVAAALKKRADELDDLSWADRWLMFGRAADTALQRLDALLLRKAPVGDVGLGV